MSAAQAFALTCLLGAVGSAAGADGLPDDCTHYLTVQSRSCFMTQHYTCAGSPGDLWDLNYDAAGPYSLTRTDAETHWVSTQSLTGDYGSQTLPSPADPISLSNLLATSFDTYDFEERLSSGQIARFRGFDRLTGETVVIDGEPLLLTAFEFRMTDAETGTEYSVVSGQQYVSERHRMFFSGVTNVRNGSGETTDLGAPVAFLYPGQAGFLSTTPIHDCEGLMSALPLSGDHA